MSQELGIIVILVLGQLLMGVDIDDCFISSNVKVRGIIHTS